MKAVLLAAGRSFRTKPIEDKNFLAFCGSFLIEHQIKALMAAGFKDIVVVGGAHNLERLNVIAAQAKVSVVEQKDLDAGMAGAVLSAEKWIDGEPFLVVSSNDVLSNKAFALMKKAIAADKKGQKGFMLAKKVAEYFPGGYLKLAKNGAISTIVEKPGEGNEPSDLVNIVMHFHSQTKDLFKALHKATSARDDRYEAALQSLFDSGKVYEAVSYSDFWQPIKYPWHILDVMEYFLPKSGTVVRGKNVSVAKSAVINGPVILDDGARIFDNAVINGPAFIGKEAVVATGALVRASHIGARSVVGYGTEIARSYLADDVWTHTNYIGDSVIGNNVSFGSGAVTGNLRLDEGPISVNIKTEKISSKRTKLGIITGDNIRCGINTSFMPGIRIGSNSVIGAGIVVSKDIPDGQFVRGEHTLKMSPNTTKIGVRSKM